MATFDVNDERHRHVNPATNPNLSPRQKQSRQLQFLKELHKRHLDQLKEIRKDNQTFERLENVRRKAVHKTKMVKKIQKHWKQHYHSNCEHDAWVRVDKAARFIQLAWRKYLFFFRIRKQLKQKREDAALKIQSNWRRFVQAQKFVIELNRRKMNAHFNYFADIKARIELEAGTKILRQFRLYRKRKAEKLAKQRALKGKNARRGTINRRLPTFKKTKSVSPQKNQSSPETKVNNEAKNDTAVEQLHMVRAQSLPKSQIQK